MQEPQNYLVLAYYIFTTIADPHNEVELHKKFFASRDATCRIYISEQGINGQMSAAADDAEEYIKWMHSRPLFETMKFKIHTHHENVFPRLTIKYRKHLVGYDREVDPAKGGEHVSPKKWDDMLENTPSKILLDVRNEYESKVGHFEGAELPPCENFREFEAYAEKLKQTTNPKETPVMMYCTGGIRCELYSTILKEHGFEKVYQLDGGVINYGLTHGSKHWLGKLFVFDDRMAIPINDEETPIIGKCHHCHAPIENYYNCANMDCNELFLCCGECLQKFSGCCHSGCCEAPRVRPYHHQDPHKPFRKWYYYSKSKSSSQATGASDMALS